MSRSRDVSAVQNNLGVAIPPAAAGKNVLINGNFDIWQRGTSGSANSYSAGAGYNADRWQNYSLNAITVSRQATSDTTNLPNIQYCARVQRNSGQTNTGPVYIAQTVETVNAIAFAGKTVTLSFYARKGANFSATSDLLSARVDTGTGTDQNVLTGFTGGVQPLSTTFTLTTTWQRFSVSGTIASTATEFGALFFYTPTGTAGTNDYFEITGVQLELGSSATPFSRAGGTIQGELANCQRYYVRFNANSTNTYIGSGNAYSTSASIPMVQMPVEMRIAPTSIDYAGVMITDDATNYSGGTVTLDRTAKLNVGIKYVHSSATLTAFRFYYLGLLIGSNGYLGINAEL